MPIKLISIWLLLFSCCISVTAFAEDTEYDCSPETGMRNTHEMLYCGYQAFNRADKALNQNYKILMGMLSTKQKKSLVQSELAWIKYRDTTCYYEGLLFDGGTQQPVSEVNCRALVTQDRNRWLEQEIANHDN